MNRLLIPLLAMCMLLAGCTDTEQFRVNGTVEGKPTLNMRVGYYADGTYHTLITAAREGKFEFFGKSRQPTIVEILDYDYTPMGRLYVGNGQTIECKLVRGNPYAIEVHGNDISEEWSDMLRTNAEVLKNGGEEANKVIADYILAHPDNIVSTLLLTTSYDSASDPAMADSLLSTITPQARPSAITDGYNYLLQRLVAETVDEKVLPFKYVDLDDSIRTFRASGSPYSLLSFDSGRTSHKETVNPLLKRIYPKTKKKLAIIDISTEPEKSVWSFEARKDSSEWERAWTPGALSSVGIDRLGIPSTPYFIVCDSAGLQLIRTKSVKSLEQFTDSILKQH